MVLSIHVLLQPQFIVLNELVGYEHKRTSCSHIPCYCIEGSSRQNTFAYHHIHLFISHLRTDFTYIYPTFQETLTQHSKIEVRLAHNQKDHIPDQNRQIPFEESQVGSQQFYFVRLKPYNILYFVFGDDPGFDGIQRIGDEMRKSGEDAGSDGFMDYGGFFFNLWYVCFAMCLMVLLHDE